MPSEKEDVARAILLTDCIVSSVLFLYLSGRAGDGGSASTSDSTRDDAFRSLFSNRLDDFMDSTSSTGDIFPPPLASSRSGA